ncbi:MAG: hypothetical protein MR891_00590 [Bacteroidales bacterium]|nr:hypothetical protein [Bacteroidales bacterium]
MKKIFLILVMALCCGNIFAQQRHRLSNGEPYDIFLSVRPTAGMALGDFNKNYTYIYGADLAFEMQLEETKLGLGVTIGYNYCVPQSFKLSYLPAKYNWAAHQVPILLTANYYLYNEVFKPFVGIGIGAVWGRYDYSLSSQASINQYYLQDFEGQSGWRATIVPKVGLLVSTNHRHGFGIEFSLPYCFGAWRLETQYSANVAFNYTFIID